MRARAETVEADGDVQVRLSDGTRVWADRLEGDARRDVAQLFGGRIIVIRLGIRFLIAGRISFWTKSRRTCTGSPGRGRPARLTLMRWTRSMAMTAMDSTRSRIVLDGQVEAVHRRTSGETSTLTGERLEAVVARATGGPSGAIDLGEAMQLERLAGWGAIYVRTPERDVTCDEFDYDVATGCADARAGPGRTVSVLDRGSAIPSHHRRIEWNMIDDTITLYDGAAGGAP